MCKIVATNTLDFPYYRGIDRQRGHGFGAFAQDIERTAILFLRKYIFPAAKRVGADFLEFAVPKLADLVSGQKSFKTDAKNVGRQTLRKQPGGGRQKRSFPFKKLKQRSRSCGDIFNNIVN